MDNISQLFLEYGGWSWLILGALLLVIEILAPGVFMLWFGLAAMVTGALTLAVNLGFQGQLIVFTVTSLVCVLVGRKLFTGTRSESDQPNLSRRGDQLIGKVFTVSQPIEHGSGKIKIGDTHWPASGPDLPVGARVRVVSVEGNRLIVETDQQA